MLPDKKLEIFGKILHTIEVPTSGAVRTFALPPKMQRLPFFFPLSRAQGATPIRAATLRPGISSSSVTAQVTSELPVWLAGSGRRARIDAIAVPAVKFAKAAQFMPISVISELVLT